MNTLISKFEPADIVAALLIVGGLFLKYHGADGTVTALLSAISFYYFGQRVRAKQNTNDKTGQTSTGDHIS